ncbi:PWWP domain protein [Cucumis melo var. makuwa]|uniref:PWWP domain protein n=2 Tax=Cucumis melo TaxID=3656 RepID=A0A5D3DNG7_CUCMM|nr:PWWP domain protein [Cucumis melo var. makuwa]
MAKKRKTSPKKKGETQSPLIDNIPKYSQQRRSSPPKRRTDFSSLFFYSSSIPHQDPAALLRLSLNEVGSSKLMVNHSDNTNEELSSSSLVKCSNSLEEDEGLSLCSSPDEMQSVECRLSNSSCKRKGTSKISFPVGKKLPDSESNSLSGTPENVQLWSTESFEERSSNTTVEFQDQSCDKGSSSNSSRIEDNDLHQDRGRGKRERKPKVPFDEEMTISLKSTRKFRRMRIMRYLGLAAPVGSPFSPIA